MTILRKQGWSEDVEMGQLPVVSIPDGRKGLGWLSSSAPPDVMHAALSAASANDAASSTASSRTRGQPQQRPDASKAKLRARSASPPSRRRAGREPKPITPANRKAHKASKKVQMSGREAKRRNAAQAQQDFDEQFEAAAHISRMQTSAPAFLRSSDVTPTGDKGADTGVSSSSSPLPAQSDATTTGAASSEQSTSALTPAYSSPSEYRAGMVVHPRPRATPSATAVDSGEQSTRSGRAGGGRGGHPGGGGRGAIAGRGGGSPVSKHKTKNKKK